MESNVNSLSFKIDSRHEALQGWRYFWCKNVKGFKADVHCARCLVGSYEKRVGTRAPVNVAVPLTGHHTGDLLYFCGVAMPYRWANNFHLAVRVQPGSVTTAPMSNGDTFIVHGAARVAFDAAAAERSFAGRGKDFLTCRNFQFGAQFASQLRCD